MTPATMTTAITIGTASRRDLLDSGPAGGACAGASLRTSEGGSGILQTSSLGPSPGIARLAWRSQGPKTTLNWRALTAHVLRWFRAMARS